MKRQIGRTVPIVVAVSVVGVWLTIGLWTLPAAGQLIYQESFEGNANGYDVGEESYAERDPTLDWSPGIWGLNTIGEQIGLQQDAPARRAAIQWDHAAFADDFTDEAYATWVSLVDWGAGVTDPAARKDVRVGFYGGYLEESVEAIKDTLVGSGYADGKMLEIIDPTEVAPENMEVLIHSSALTSTLFSGVEVPVISFDAPTHDDAAIAGIGVATSYVDPVVLEIPVEHRSHPALGGNGADGMIPWSTRGVTLQGIGKTHNGGKAIALAEDPVTGALGAAIFVIEKGAPLLGAFNPDPEGDRYIVGSALNKHGLAGEVTLELNPVNVAGYNDVRMTVALAATAADFENGDYLRIEAATDGGDYEILEEFFGVDEAHDPANLSGCLKGLSNGFEPGADGDICLPTEQFGNFEWKLPAGASTVQVRFSLLNTWGNEITGIDNVRIHSGPLTEVPPVKVLHAGDADQDLDFDQLDLVKVQIAAKYLTGQAATWGDGDWNGAPGGSQGSPPPGKSRFDQLDIIAALANNKYLTGPYAAVAPGGARGDGQTSVVYNPATGELAVDAPAAVQLTSINIDSAGRVFTGAPAQNLGGSFDNDGDNNIFKATFGSSFGSLSFGNVAQPGLSQSFLLADLSVVGSLAGGGALGNVDLMYIPEPASMVLFGLAVAAFCGYALRHRKGG